MIDNKHIFWLSKSSLTEGVGRSKQKRVYTKKPKLPALPTRKSARQAGRVIPNMADHGLDEASDPSEDTPYSDSGNEGGYYGNYEDEISNGSQQRAEVCDRLS